MNAKIDEVKADGIVTRDELLAMGCTEVKSKTSNRVAFMLSEEVVAVECMECESIQRHDRFRVSKKGFMRASSKCKICLKAFERKDRKEDPWKYEERLVKFHSTNPRYNIERLRKFRDTHPEIYRERRRKDREDYAEYYKAYRREYRLNNPKIIKLSKHLRRARLALLLNDETIEQRTKVWADFGNTCALTGEELDVSADHAVPINVGHSGTTYGNMWPLNRRLNFSKHDAHLYEWFDANHARFGLSRDKFDDLIEYLAGANEMTPTEYRKYTDWCFDNPRTIDEATGELVFINERKTIS